MGSFCFNTIKAEICDRLLEIVDAFQLCNLNFQTLHAWFMYKFVSLPDYSLPGNYMFKRYTTGLALGKRVWIMTLSEEFLVLQWHILLHGVLYLLACDSVTVKCSLLARFS